MNETEEKDLLNRIRMIEMGQEMTLRHIVQLEEAVCRAIGALEMQLAAQKKTLEVLQQPPDTIGQLFHRRWRQQAIEIARSDIGLPERPVLPDAPGFHGPQN